MLTKTKWKRKSPDNISFFHTFSHNAPPIPRPVSPFLQVVLVDGIPISSCRPYSVSLWHFSRWHFNPWTVCFPDLLLPSESNFPQSTMLYWRLCGLTNSPIVKYPLNWGWCAWSAEGSLKWLPSSEWQTASVVSHKMPWCAMLTAVKS